jgi:hypothetical protein
VSPDPDFPLESAIADAISLVLRQHGYFYDRHGSIGRDKGMSGALNKGGIRVRFKITRGFKGSFPEAPSAPRGEEA